MMLASFLSSADIFFLSFLLPLLGIYGVVQSSTADNHRVGSMCAVLVLGFNWDAHDAPHLNATVTTV